MKALDILQMMAKVTLQEKGRYALRKAVYHNRSTQPNPETYW